MKLPAPLRRWNVWRRHLRSVPSQAVICLAASTFFASAAVAGQAPAGAEKRDPPADQARRRPDFLFGPPHGWFGVRVGWLFARTDSDLFDFVERQLTIDDGDFDTSFIAFDLGFPVTPRVDALFGIEFVEAPIASEYRDYVDNNFRPIAQDTSLKQVNVSGSVRFSPTPRGREVGRFAWVPRSVVPYVGAGGGLLWYQFKQTGDFVDFTDLSVFGDVFLSEGWTPSVHAFGGVDLKIHRRVFLDFEGRYLWAAGELGQDFVGFDPVDLAGFRLTAGVSVLF